MRIQLEISYVRALADISKNNWWHETNIIEYVISSSCRNEMLNLRYFSTDDKYMDITPILKEPSSYKSRIKEGPWGSSFYLTEKKSTDQNSVHFYFLDDYFQINLFVDYDEKSNQLDQLVDFLLDFFISYQDMILIGPSINIGISYPFPNYPKLRPPMNYFNLYEFALVNFFHLPYVESHPQTEIKGYKNLLNTPLPAGATLEKHGKLYMIKWTGKILSPDQLEEVFIMREDFVYKHLELELDRDFNLHGDKNIFNISSLEKVSLKEDFFNFYREKGEMAFKLITLNENLKLDPETVSKINDYKKNRRLKSGESINKIILILPSRKTAVSVELEAKNLGVYKVLYLDNEADLWDMNPVGNWRN